MNSTPVTQAVPRAPVHEREQQHRQLREAAEAFESILIQHLFRRMREAQLEEGFFGEGTGASTYEGIFEERLAIQVAEGSPFGIADMLEAQWLDRGAQREEGLARLREAEALRAHETIRDVLQGDGGIPAQPVRTTPTDPPPDARQTQDSPGEADKER